MMRVGFCLLLLSSLSAAHAEDMGGRQAIVATNDILRGSFVEQRQLKGFNGPMRSEGHFVVAPAHGIIWGMEKPFPTTTVITPAGLAQSVNGAMVMQLPSQKIPFMLHLYETLGGALTGNWAALETDFIVTRKGDVQQWQVTLAPRQADNPAMPFSSIDIKGARFVENVVMSKPDGDTDTLTFLDEKVSTASLTDSEKRVFASVHP